jgi:hypothetical protein
MIHTRTRSLILTLLVLLGLWTGAAYACNVPVFRYALERWDADVYYAVVVHGEEGLSEREQSAFDLLKQCSISDTSVMNLDVYQYSRETLAGSQFASIFNEDEGSSGETMLYLFHPSSAKESGPVWKAPLTQANVHRLLADPDRLELLNKILSGTSVIMLMLESGNTEQDEAAWEKLKQGVEKTSEYLGLPEGIVMTDGTVTGDGMASMDPADKLWSSIPLKLEFSLLRTKMTPENAVLVQSLLSIESGLQQRTDSPMVFPVFGRGRFLYPMIADDITEDNILYASHYVCGACSCEIKAQNPGMELPILMDWESIFYEKEPLLTMQQFLDTSGLEQTDESGKSISIDLEISNRTLLIVFLFISTGILAGIILFLKRRLS